MCNERTLLDSARLQNLLELDQLRSRPICGYASYFFVFLNY
jgi:hypothetical protein